MTDERLRELKRLSENFRYISSVNTDWVSGRRDGLTDDQTEEVAQKTLYEMMTAIEELIDSALSKPHSEDVQRAIDVDVAMSWFKEPEKYVYKHCVKGHEDYTSTMPEKVVQTILAALKAYRQPVGDESIQDALDEVNRVMSDMEAYMASCPNANIDYMQREIKKYETMRTALRQVPKGCECDKCGGKGFISDYSDEKGMFEVDCEICNGSGRNLKGGE